MNTQDNNNTNIVLLLLLSILAVSCSYDFPVEPGSNEGERLPESFSNFYVLGDSYASGFMDGALYKGGQEFSYPNIFGKKLEEIYGRPVFQQAEVADENGFNAEATAEKGALMGKYSLLYRSTLSIYPARHPSEGEQIAGWSGSLADLRDFSIPGMKSFAADSIGALANNLYYSRLNLGSLTPADLIVERQPGVVLINLGYRDILNYALFGGAGDENPGADNIGEHDLTPLSLFKSTLERTVTRILSETDSEIIIANIFNPLLTPYFQTLDYALEVEKYTAAYLGDVEAHYADFNYNVFLFNDVEDGGAPDDLDRPIIIVDPMGYPQISANNRARVLVDEDLNDAVLNDGTVIPKWRQLTANELVLYKIEPDLNQSSPLSGKIPLSDEQTLTEPEIEIINQRVDAFNLVIRNLVSANTRIHLLDISSVINDIREDEYIFAGVRPSVAFNRYGIFSADGYTLNPKGNAIIANELIKTVNQLYDTNLLLVDPNAYRGNEFLGGFN